MSTETLTDKDHNTVGYIEDRGNQLVGMDKNHNLVGYYEKNVNKTLDKNLNHVANGNILASLIFKA